MRFKDIENKIFKTVGSRTIWETSKPITRTELKTRTVQEYTTHKHDHDPDTYSFYDTISIKIQTLIFDSKDDKSWAKQYLKELKKEGYLIEITEAEKMEILNNWKAKEEIITQYKGSGASDDWGQNKVNQINLDNYDY
jgi:hypothetical protein